MAHTNQHKTLLFVMFSQLECKIPGRNEIDWAITWMTFLLIGSEVKGILLIGLMANTKFVSACCYHLKENWITIGICWIHINMHAYALCCIHFENQISMRNFSLASKLFSRFSLTFALDFLFSVFRWTSLGIYVMCILIARQITTHTDFLSFDVFIFFLKGVKKETQNTVKEIIFNI